MSTVDRRVSLFLKKFLPQQQIADNFLDYLLTQARDSLKTVYPLQGVFFGGNLSGSAPDEISVSAPMLGTDGLGRLLDLDPLYVAAKFQNTLAIPYHVGLRYSELPRSTEVNVRTGKIEYTFIEEQVGERGVPGTVTDNGTTITFVVDSVTEAAVSNAGRQVLVWLKNAVSQADAFFQGTVYFSGGLNKIDTTHLLGQTAGQVSVLSANYEIFLLGPTVKRNTDLSLDPNIIYLGTVTGAGAGNTPATFDQSNRRILPQLVGTPGTGIMAQILTLLEGGGTIKHDETTVGLVSWAGALKVRPLGTASELTVNAANITLADDEVAYLTLPIPFVSGTVVMQKAARSSALLNSNDKFWIFHRNGLAINVRGGMQLEQGEQRQLEDMVIGNSIFFSNDDKIRFDEALNSYHFDVDGGTDNAQAVSGKFRMVLLELYAGALANNDLLKFVEGVTPQWQLLTNNVVRWFTTEAGDAVASQDSLSQAGTAYANPSTPTAPIAAVNASLNEVYDQTKTRNLLRVTANNPATKAVNVGAGRLSIVSGEQVGLVQANNVVSYAGGTVNFETGVVTGGGSNFVPYTPTAPSRFFKYAVVLTALNQLLVILPTGDAATALAAAEPPVGGGIPVAVVTVQDNGAGGSGTVNNLSETAFLRFGAAGGTTSGGSGTGVGDDLDSLSFRVSVTDPFTVSPADTLSTVDAGAGKTDPATFSTIESYFRLNYDATKTVTGVGVSQTISGAPSFTVKIGDILVVGIEARRITGVAGLVYTIESAFTANPVAAPCNVSQVVYTKDLNAFAGDGLAASAAIATAINAAMVNYEDTATLVDVILDLGVTPHVAFSLSADGASYSTVKARTTALTSSMAIINPPAPGANLYLRFFANKVAVSGQVNLLGYKVFFHRDTTANDGPVFDAAYLFTDGVGTEVNCLAPTVVGGKTRISLNWTYPTGINPGGPIGVLDVYINGQIVPRFIDGTLTPDASYTEVNSTTIDLDADYSGFNFNVEILKRVAVIDESTTNSLRLQNLADAIVGSAIQVAAGQATHTTLTAALAAVAVGGNILILEGTFTENVSVNKKVTIRGRGHLSVLNGTVAFTSAAAFGSFKQMRILDNVTFAVGADAIFFTEIWIAVTKTVTDSGVANYKLYITE